MKFHTIILALLFFSFLTGQCRAQGNASRGLFVSVIQETSVFASRQSIRGLVDFARRSDVNELFVQIYRANQAWFPSSVGDPGPYERCTSEVGEDPFALLIREAHAAGIRVHAWVNVLSLGANVDSPLLKKYGPGILTRNRAPKAELRDYRIDDQFFLEPGDVRVRGELATLVKEIVASYPGLDGIQYDYIRYPDKDPAYGYTETNLARFSRLCPNAEARESDLAWLDWKREQVTELLELLVVTARGLRPDMRVSITGCVPYVRAYSEAFQDWQSWVNSGLVDFVTVMNYSADFPEFKRFFLEARSKSEDVSRLNFTVGAYKLLNAPETFRRLFSFCEEESGGSCVIFHYGNLVDSPELMNVINPARGTPRLKNNFQ